MPGSQLALISNLCDAGSGGHASRSNGGGKSDARGSNDHDASHHDGSVRDPNGCDGGHDGNDDDDNALASKDSWCQMMRQQQRLVTEQLEQPKLA